MLAWKTASLKNTIEATKNITNFVVINNFPIFKRAKLSVCSSYKELRSIANQCFTKVFLSD
jgi:hypothetical protein